jgi:hypothetical protein
VVELDISFGKCSHLLYHFSSTLEHSFVSFLPDVPLTLSAPPVRSFRLGDMRPGEL